MISSPDTKYPRTPHLPSSPGATRDDRILDAASLGGLLGLERELVITEKLDGSNVALRADSPYPFARSHAGSPAHPSFDPLKAIHAAFQPFLPEAATVYGEWRYAVHSHVYPGISTDDYANLFLFAIRDDDGHWRSWEAVETLAFSLGLHAAPVLDRHAFVREEDLQAEAARLGGKPSVLGGVREGVVIRDSGGFSDSKFPTRVAKWVRSFSIGEHWSQRSVLTHESAFRSRSTGGERSPK